MKSLTDISSRFIENIVRKRNDNFDNGITDIYKCKYPVISIGNLTFGGSGKTPLTIALASELIDAGIKPIVIGSGYKRKYSDINIVSDGNNILTNWQNSGDEMFLIAKKLNVPVVVHKQKFQAAKIASQFDADIVLLDDGFQHRYLHRILDLVIIDKNTIQNPWLPPKGKLREPVDSLSRADFIIADEELTLPDMFSDLVSEKPVRFRIYPGNVYDLTTELEQSLLTEPVIAFCGIANPHRFMTVLNNNEIDVSVTYTFRDHHAYNKNDIYKLVKMADKYKIRTFITTEKDAVKLEEYSELIDELRIRILVLPIKLKITEGKEQLIFQIVKKLEEYS